MTESLLERDVYDCGCAFETRVRHYQGGDVKTVYQIPCDEHARLTGTQLLPDS